MLFQNKTVLVTLKLYSYDFDKTWDEKKRLEAEREEDYDMKECIFRKEYEYFTEDWSRKLYDKDHPDFSDGSYKDGLDYIQNDGQFY